MTGNPYEVTIVVPVYNVEQYLPETLQSIAAQTVFDRCRVILVDDGSTDASETIAKEFAAEHPNVIAMRQDNAGPGAARNLAMDMADTPFIAFCDSDDILPPRAIERLLTAIVIHGASISVGNMDTFPKPTNFPWKRYFGKGDRCLETIADAPDLIFDAGPCHKLYDLGQLRAHGLRFREGVHFEDAFLAVPMLLKAERIALVDELVYQYRKRATQDSIMDGLFTRPKNYWDHLELVSHLAEMRADLDVFRYEALERFLVRSYQGFAMRAHELFDEPDLRTIFDVCRDIYQHIEVSFIIRWTLDTRHRVPYLAFKLDDFDLFARPQQLLRSVRASGGDLYLDYPVPPRLLPLTKVSRYDALVEQARVDASTDELEISGQFVINGLPLAYPPTMGLALRVRGSGLTVPAAPTSRSDLKVARVDLEWSGFKARVPIAQLRSGHHDLRLVFLTETGQASRRCKITANYLREARPITAGGRHILFRFVNPDRATIIIGPDVGRESRRKWQRMLLRKDLAHIRHRRPFWKHRLVRMLTAPFMRRRDIWLIGERRDTAQDNSWHLFRHMRKMEGRRNVYYVIDKNSQDRKRLRGLGHVIGHSSRRHKFLMLHATKLINSYDIDSYMLPDGWNRTNWLKNLSWRVGARRVFLQHGVIYNDVSPALHRARAGIDLFVTSAEAERNFIAERFDYGNLVRDLGLPRFDALVPDRGRKKVLFMPTWRVYLVAPSYDRNLLSPVNFEGSAYQRFLVDLFHSPTLREALNRHGYTLEFLPHYEMRGVVSDVVPPDDCFSLVDQSTRTVQDALRQCDLFVTDWSSTAFDVAYLGTPVIYAQFDAEEYRTRQYRKGYFDTERDGFGPVCETAEQTVEAIVNYLENGCVREEEYTRRTEEFFTHHDRNNSARVSSAIAAL